jgi:hypothetical protein
MSFIDLRHRELIRLFRRRLGPGPSKLQLEEAIRNAVGDNIGAPARVLGQIVKLTFVERTELDIRTIQCCDKSPEEIRAHYRAKRRERDRTGARKRRNRRKKRMIPLKMQRQTGRVQAVLREVSETNPTHWSTIESITDLVAKARDFRGLKPNSMRKTIHRSLDTLFDEGHIETDTGFGRRMPVKLVRWKP